MGGRSIGILSLGTAVPHYRVDQEQCGHWISAALGERPALSRWIRQLYRLSGIETRYSCLPEAASFDMTSRFLPGQPIDQTPSTEERMDLYQRNSVQIATAAAREALDELGPDAADQITHLIVVSCTGFFAPGPDIVLMRNLALRPTVERTVVGFMGCAAAFNGLRLARHIVRGQPEARVLVVCVELCTLHLQPGDDRITLVSSALFADGAGACVVGTTDDLTQDALLLDDFYTNVLPNSERAMGWRIGNNGFAIELSTEVPQLVGDIAPTALARLFGDTRPDFWAVHPGGRAIVDRIVELFNLTDEEAAPSYDTLRHYGNMSSPTILFVLRDVRERLRQASAHVASGVAMAFGPGLVAEMARLTYQPVVKDARLTRGQF